MDWCWVTLYSIDISKYWVSERMNHYEYKGSPHTIKQLSELSGIAPATIRDRLRRGYSVTQAISLAPTNDSVDQFCMSSMWTDWIGMSISDLYEIYWKWSIQNGYTPSAKQGFSRQLFSINPWLKTVPTKRNGKSYRIIRPKN